MKRVILVVLATILSGWSINGVLAQGYAIEFIGNAADQVEAKDSPSLDINGKAFTMMSSDDPTKKLCRGKVTEWVEPSKLAYEFSVFMMEDLITHVTWQLEEVESGTKLTMVHTGLPADSNGIALTFALDAGWDKHFASLRDASKAAQRQKY